MVPIMFGCSAAVRQTSLSLLLLHSSLLVSSILGSRMTILRKLSWGIRPFRRCPLLVLL
jgi:hypothetical protein